MAAPRQWTRRRTTIVAGIVIVLAVVAAGLYAAIEHAQDRLLSGIHDNCVGSATDTARARGVDVAGAEITQKIERYCRCVAGAVKSGDVTTAELNAFSTDPQAIDPTTLKVRQVVATCLH